jgi:alpha-soluble NSF attachment protein
MEYLTVPLLKSSAKDLFFKCVVLFLIKKDDVTAEIYLNKFLEEDPTFDDTREVKFLREAIRCVSEPPDPDGFRKAVADFKQYRDLDKWKLNMFAAVLKGIEVADDDFK